MARFYETTPRNYVDGFIFQPNWELAQTALAKKDADIQGQLDSLELFRNLPIDFWKDADQGNVETLRKEYETKVDDIARGMQGDLLNTNNNRYSINKLRREIEKDYETGRIRQIQDNAEAYRQFSSKLSSLPNPEDRQGYLAMVSNYLSDVDGQGAFSKIFTPDEMYNMRDIWGEFTASDAFKSLKPDERASKITNTNGRYFVTQGSNTVELSQSKIGQAFDAFLNSSNLKGYGADRQKYFGQEWIDENGNIRKDAGSYLGNILETGIPSLAYQNKGVTKDMSVDQYGVLAAQEAMQKRAEARAAYRQKMQDSQIPPELSKNASFAARTASNMVDIVNNKLKVLGNQYKLQLNTSNLNELIAWGKKNGKGAFTQELITLQTNLNESLRASYEPLYAMGYNKDYVEKFKKNVQDGIELKGLNVKGYLDLNGIGVPANGDMSKRLSINELAGRTIGDRKVRSADIVQGSSFPVFFGTSDLVNQIQSTVKIEFEPRKDTAGNIIDEGEDNTKFVDYYQSSREITGDNSIKLDIIKANNR